MTAGTLVSKPSTSNIPQSFGSARRKQIPKVAASTFPIFL